MTTSEEVFKLSAIELAKAVSALRGVADNKREFDVLKRTFVPTGQIERVDQILKGLSQEDEFAIFCRVMGTCKSISRIGQSPILDSLEIAPDFLASFRPGVSVDGLDVDEVDVTYNCLVEVKSSSKPKFKISGRDLKARQLFASRFGLPLVFAIRFTSFGEHTLWILFTAKELEARGGKIHCTDLPQSISPALFNDYGLHTHPNFRLVHNYDTTAATTTITHAQFGALTHTFIVASNCDPIEVPTSFAGLVNVLFHSFDLQVERIQQEGRMTGVIYNVGNQMRLLSDLVYGCNYLACDENGDQAFDAGRVIARLDSESKPALFDRRMIEEVVSWLNRQSEIFFKIGIASGQGAQTLRLKNLLRVAS